MRELFNLFVKFFCLHAGCLTLVHTTLFSKDFQLQLAEIYFFNFLANYSLESFGTTNLRSSFVREEELPFIMLRQKRGGNQLFPMNNLFVSLYFLCKLGDCFEAFKIVLSLLRKFLNNLNFNTHLIKRLLHAWFVCTIFITGADLGFFKHQS